MLGLGIGRTIDKVFPGAIDVLDKGLSYFRGSFLQEPAPASQTDPVAELATIEAIDSDGAVMARAVSILERAVALGRAGQFTVIPEFFSISATDNCNLRCTMCPGHAGMTGPRLSLDQAESVFGNLGSNHADFGRPRVLDMTAGEPLLNNELHLIFRKFKEIVPEARIEVISNATFPIKGRVREAFELADRIGLSIDGATQETYERIRKGSRFENVVRNITEIASLKQSAYGAVSILFVAMDENIHELPALIRLAKEMGIPEVFAQAVEIRTTPFLEEGDNIDLKTPAPQIRAYLSEASAEAERLGIRFHPTNGLVELGQNKQTEGTSRDFRPVAGKNTVHPEDATTSFLEGIRLCNVPWMISPRIGLDAEGVRPTTACCHMPNTELSGNLYKIKDFWGKSISYIYNSEHYWNIRQGLLDGTIAKDACRGCQYYQSTQWTADQLRILEKSVEKAVVKNDHPESYANTSTRA